MIITEERERMVELIHGNRYIALATVSRFLRPEIFIDMALPKAKQMTRSFMAEVKGILDGLCSVPSSEIGKLGQEDARNFYLRGNVYYSAAWMVRQQETAVSLTAAGQVGLSIYEELQDISKQLYKVTDNLESALTYPSVAVLARMGVRNHQDIVDVGEYFKFLGIFMQMKAPYAFRLAEELENAQPTREMQRISNATKIYEQLATDFAYEPARQKLQK